VSALQAVWDAAWGAIKSVASSVWTVLSPVFNALVHSGLWLIRNEIKGLQIIWTAIWTSIQNVVSGVWDFLKPIFDAIMSAIHAITKGLGTVGSIASKVGGAVGAVGHAFGFAGGTDFAPGGLTLVGEEGSEYVDLPRGSRVYPHGMTPATGSGTTINVHIGTAYGADARELADKVVDAINSRVRETGAVFRSGAVLT